MVSSVNGGYKSLCHIFPSGHCSHNSLTWLSDTPVWVDQWPLKGERLEQTCLLVKQQLEAGHTEPSNSPWNTPIFVVLKKSGK